MYNNFVGRDGI